MNDTTNNLLAVQQLQTAKDQLAVIYGQISENTSEKIQVKFYEVISLIQQACKTSKMASMSILFLGFKDPYSVHHAIDRAIISEILGVSLGISDSFRISLLGAALSMRIDCIQLQNELQNTTETLSDEARETMFNCAINSLQLLEKSDVQDARWLEILKNPDESSPDTSFEASVLAVSDRYAAMISPRGSRSGLASNNIIQQFLIKYQKALDSTVVSTLFREFGLYPPGVILKLQTGENAVSIHPGKQMYAPTVYLLTEEGQIIPKPVLCNKEDIDSVYALKLKPDFALSAEDLWANNAQE